MKVHLYGGRSLEDPLSGLNLDPRCMGGRGGEPGSHCFSNLHAYWGWAQSAAVRVLMKTLHSFPSPGRSDP